MSRTLRHGVTKDTTVGDAMNKTKHDKRTASNNKSAAKSARQVGKVKAPAPVDTLKKRFYTPEKHAMYVALSSNKKAIPQKMWCPPIDFKFFYCNEAAKSNGGKVHTWRCRHVQSSCDSKTLAPVQTAAGQFEASDCCSECFQA